MNRKSRRFIFYIFLVLFIVLAFVVILYAQGYSFDWQKKSLVITGAFYFKSYPKEVNIYLNNKYKGKTNKFIKRLPPEEYDVKISKPGYHDWQKTLKIDSKLVTEAKNILLVKKDPIVTQITEYNVKHFSFSNDKKRVIYLTDRATKEIDPIKQKIADPREIPTYSKFALRLLDLTDNTDIQINSSISNLKNLSNISWSSDDKKLLLSFPDDYYYIVDLENPSKIISLNNLIKVASNYKIYSIKNLAFHPQDPNKIYFFTNNNLYLIDLVNVSLSISDDSNEQITAKIPKNVEETQRSDDNKKLLWRTKNEIGVIWLEPDFDQPSRTKDETEIIMKTFKEIDQAIWYSGTDQHIIFVIGDEIKVTELDGRDRRNTMNILTTKNPKVFYNKRNKKLYILSEERLLEIE